MLWENSSVVVVAVAAAAAAAAVVVTRARKFEPTIKGSGRPEIASQFHPGRANSYINHTKRPNNRVTRRAHDVVDAETHCTVTRLSERLRTLPRGPGRSP